MSCSEDCAHRGHPGRNGQLLAVHQAPNLMRSKSRMRAAAILLLISLACLVDRSFAAEPYDYAALWRSWDLTAREAYITGVVDGMAHAYIETTTSLAPDKLRSPNPPREVAELREKLFVRYTRTQLREVVTDLYGDPANSLIRPLDVLLLARDKIEGKNIEDSLIKARARAMETHRLNEEMRQR